jgi:hypothetical protein
MRGEMGGCADPLDPAARDKFQCVRIGYIEEREFNAR